MFVDKCVFSQGALAEICTGSVKNLVRYGAMHQLGNYAIHDVHMVAYLMTGIPINNDNIQIVNILTLWRCSFSCTDYFGECPEFTPPHTKYTDHFSKRGFPKTVLTGTIFHKQLGFSAFSNLELPGLPHYPVAIIEADSSNVLSGSDWLLEADYWLWAKTPHRSFGLWGVKWDV